MRGVPSTEKLAAELSVTAMDLPGSSVGRRALTGKRRRSENVSLCGITWYGNNKGSIIECCCDC